MRFSGSEFSVPGIFPAPEVEWEAAVGFGDDEDVAGESDEPTLSLVRTAAVELRYLYPRTARVPFRRRRNDEGVL